MARIPYDTANAAAFEATRHLPHSSVAAWRDAVTRRLEPHPGMRVLDVGSGTGMWAHAFTTWYDSIEVIAVEPSEAMRARSVYQPVVPGDADHIPLDDASVDAAWLSTVLHHIPDLTRAARELHRILRPGGRVLIRSAFAGRHHAITLFRYFPEAIRILDTYPSVADVEAAFATAGFATVGLDQVPQVTATSLREAATALRREAHTPLQLITDVEYAAGLARLHKAAQTDAGPVIDALDLLILT
jgi:ubiquinone/menaquinone biosynthesis C-methylase UbiE